MIKLVLIKWNKVKIKLGLLSPQSSTVTFSAVFTQAFVKFVKSISPNRINMCLL